MPNPGVIVPFWEAYHEELPPRRNPQNYASMTPQLIPPPPPGTFDPRTYSPIPPDREAFRRVLESGGERPAGTPPATGDGNRLKHQLFPLYAAAQDVPVVPGPVISGIRSTCEKEHGFFANTIYLGTNVTPSGAVKLGLAGFLTYQIRGLHPGGPWQREVSIAPGQQLQIRAETFLDLDIDVIASTSPGVSASVIATESVQTGTALLDDAWLLRTYTAAGIYIRPYGASHVIGSAADAGFVWWGGGPDGSASIPEGAGGLAAGVEVPTKGAEFEVTAVPISLQWRIRL